MSSSRREDLAHLLNELILRHLNVQSVSPVLQNIRQMTAVQDLLHVEQNTPMWSFKDFIEKWNDDSDQLVSKSLLPGSMIVSPMETEELK